MADGYKLWADCPYCIKGKVKSSGAQGPDPTVDVTCPQCQGTGFKFMGYCSVDTFPLPAGLPEPE